ncbi:MAG TPA: GntR family transcriptional regulator [Ramlibacter sp.]|jgi:DNA-binding GntR family transcriptional regulator|nr:GntR family transcriptional regulator [Ramlibacter sp.]
MNAPLSHSALLSRRTHLSSDEIYDRVKEMAARFEFRPNERINEIELSRSLSVSRTPLREVLNRLMVEGFLTREQNKGFIGRALDPKEILSLYEFRRGIETSTLALACDRATDDQIAELEQFTRESIDVKEDESATRLVALDEEFHLRIARLTANPEYERALLNINSRIHYIRWVDMQQRRSFTQAEHMAIVRALKRRALVDANDLLVRHITRRLDQIVDVVKAGYAEIYTRAVR